MLLTFLFGPMIVIFTILSGCFIIYELHARCYRQECQCSNQDNPPSYEEALMLQELTV